MIVVSFVKCNRRSSFGQICGELQAKLSCCFVMVKGEAKIANCYGADLAMMNDDVGCCLLLSLLDVLLGVIGFRTFPEER